LVPLMWVDDALDDMRLGKALLVHVRDEGPADVVQVAMRQRRVSALGYTLV
jgi:hypothetical protein